MAVIFEEMRPQASAVLAIDDGAAGGAGVALVGYDQFQRMAEQFDMLVIDRGRRRFARADQADRIVAAADAGLEHGELAFALLKMEAGQRKQRLERAELFAARCRNRLIWRLRSLASGARRPRRRSRRHRPDPLVETQQMRRGEEAGPQAIGAADRGAHRRRAALAVRAGHHHRMTLQPRAIDAERCPADSAMRARQMPSPYFGRSNTRAVPSRKTCDARFSGSGRRGRIAPAGGSTGWN